jgi:DNA-binding LacI/PurR family transcriptional regulator
VARSLGLDVPGDLSVVCYEGGVAAYTDPPLTVVRQPFTEMGLRCVKELLAMIDMNRDAARRRKKPENIVLPLTFQPGSSTAACPARGASRR